MYAARSASCRHGDVVAMRHRGFVTIARPTRRLGWRNYGLGSSVQEHALHTAAEAQATIDELRAAARLGEGAQTEDDCLKAIAMYQDAKVAGNMALAHAAETDAVYPALRESQREKATAMRAALNLSDLESGLVEAGRAARNATNKCMELMLDGKLRKRLTAEAETQTTERATVSVRRGSRIVDL